MSADQRVDYGERTFQPAGHEQVQYGWAFVCSEEGQEGHELCVGFSDHDIVLSGPAYTSFRDPEPTSFVNNHKVRLVRRTVIVGDWEWA